MYYWGQLLSTNGLHSSPRNWIKSWRTRCIKSLANWDISWSINYQVEQTTSSTTDQEGLIRVSLQNVGNMYPPGTSVIPGAILKWALIIFCLFYSNWVILRQSFRCEILPSILYLSPGCIITVRVAFTADHCTESQSCLRIMERKTLQLYFKLWIYGPRRRQYQWKTALLVCLCTPCSFTAGIFQS